MPKQLKISPEKCIGCKSCELACSLANDRELNPSKSRIREITFIEGKYPLPYNFVSTCRHCADAPCMETCPASAILRLNDQTKAVVVNHDRCLGCGKCVDACPFGAMLFAKETRKAYKCELCSGNPACASICPSGAIVYRSRKPFYAKNEDFQMQGYKILSRQNKRLLVKFPKPDQTLPG
jgi:carbon-monoxide dehydrogenase iron sulfur subunit